MLIIGESRERIFRCLWYCFSQPFQALIGLREKTDSNNDNDILHSLQFMAYFHIYCESDPFKSPWRQIYGVFYLYFIVNENISSAPNHMPGMAHAFSLLISQRTPRGRWSLSPSQRVTLEALGGQGTARDVNWASPRAGV